MKDMYVVYQNCLNGACWICKDGEIEENPFKFDWIFTGTKEEVEEYLKDLKEKTTFYAVFQTQDEEECYIKKMNKVSGDTYNEEMYSIYDRHVNDFDTEEEAMEYIEKYL